MARSSHSCSQLGLTTYEAKAYVALTRRDSSTAAQAARLAGVPRQRIYDVLASLVEKGLAVTRPGRVIKYAPTAPDAALEGLLERRRQELAALERSAEEMVQKPQARLDEGQEQTDPLEYIEVLRDRARINERFAELAARIKREILVFTKPPYATPAQENVEGPRGGALAPRVQRVRVLRVRRSARSSTGCAGSSRPARRLASCRSSR